MSKKEHLIIDFHVRTVALQAYHLTMLEKMCEMKRPHPRQGLEGKMQRPNRETNLGIEIRNKFDLFLIVLKVLLIGKELSQAKLL